MRPRSVTPATTPAALEGNGESGRDDLATVWRARYAGRGSKRRAVVVVNRPVVSEGKSRGIVGTVLLGRSLDHQKHNLGAGM